MSATSAQVPTGENPKSHEDELLETCTSLLAQEDNKRLAALLMLIHMPDSVIQRIRQDRSLAESLWSSIQNRSFLTRVLLTPSNMWDTNVGIYKAAALNLAVIFGAHEGLLRAHSKRFWNELVNTLYDVLVAKQRSDPNVNSDVATKVKEGLEDTLQIIANALSFREDKLDLLNATGSEKLLDGLMQAYLLDRDQQNYMSRELQVLTALTQEFQQQKDAKDRVSKHLEQSSAVQQFFEFVSSQTTTSADELTFTAIACMKNLLLLMGENHARRVLKNLTIIKQLKITLFRVISSKLDAASRHVVFSTIETITWLVGFEWMLVKDAPSNVERHKFCEILLRLASVECNVAFSEYIYIPDANDLNSEKLLRGLRDELPEDVKTQCALREQNLESCGVILKSAIEYLSQQAGLMEEDNPSRLTLSASVIQQLFSIIQQSVEYAAEYLDSVAADIVSPTWPPDAVVRTTLGLLGSWIIEGGEIDTKLEKHLTSSSTLQTLATLLIHKDLSTADSIMSMLAPQEMLRVKLCENPRVLAQITLNILSRISCSDFPTAKGHTAFGLVLELVGEIFLEESLADSPFIDDLHDAGLSTLEKYDSLIMRHLPLLANQPSVELVRMCFIASTILYSIAQRETGAEAGAKERGNFIRQVLKSSEVRRLVDECGKVLQQQFSETLKLIQKIDEL